MIDPPLPGYRQARPGLKRSSPVNSSITFSGLPHGDETFHVPGRSARLQCTVAFEAKRQIRPVSLPITVETI
ncbi:hypothetical protein EGJ52_04390 [Pseudomonas luteola]|jgi:hypothetical protein|nr:hypothetical protein EGJ52_04390 [Pseudomonas luteola]RRW50547.1 hypothetical protein EGJ50_02395 [Pseudomonas luteola]